MTYGGDKMYHEIFNDIVEIMQQDYAGCKDKMGWDYPDIFKSKLAKLEQQNELNPNSFVELVNDYLIDFKDYHVYFKLKSDSSYKERTVGFCVRRYKDKLYVTDVTHEKRLQIGDIIHSINGYSIQQLVDLHKRELIETEAEREDWTTVLRKYDICHVNREGKQYRLKLQFYESQNRQSVYKIESLNQETLLMTISDFTNPDSIRQMIEENDGLLRNTEHLIIDVRNNAGGSDTSFRALIPFIFSEGTGTYQLDDKYDMAFHATERNCQLMIDKFQQSLKNIKDKFVKRSIQALMKKWEENRGKGFVKFNDITEKKFTITGTVKPKNIIILIDTLTASSAEIFADICKLSSKVQIVGRPTSGMNDYANLTCMTWNDTFELWYPTSRLTCLDHSHMTTSRVEPDIYIPWTPEHIHKDKDIKCALKLLEKQRKVPIDK